MTAASNSDARKRRAKALAVADHCTCLHYVVDHSDPEPHHPENVDREEDPRCRVHKADAQLQRATRALHDAYHHDGSYLCTTWPCASVDRFAKQAVIALSAAHPEATS